MSHSRHLFIMALAFGLSFNAFGQLTGNYQVKVDIDNTFGGDWNNAGTTLLGWRCTSSSQVVYNEVHRDYRGQSVEVPKSIQSTFGTTLLKNPHLEMAFPADMNAASNTKVIVTENCVFDPTLVNAAARAAEKVLKQIGGGGNGRHGKHGRNGGNDIQLPRAHYDNAFMAWECQVTQPLPREVGGTLKTDCRSTNVSFPMTMQQVVANVVKDKKITATFSLQSKDETFTKNFCGDNVNDRVIFHLAGGVGGHSGENNFVFDIEVKNNRTGEKHDFSLERAGGVLNDDIAYCGSPGKRDQVSVTIHARTKHLLFKDHPYYGKDGSETVTFNLGAQGGDQSKDINLYRKSLFGNEKAKYNSNIEVTLLDPGRAHGEGSEPSLASSATTH